MTAGLTTTNNLLLLLLLLVPTTASRTWVHPLYVGPPSVQQPAVMYALRPGLGPIAQLSLMYNVQAATERRRGSDTRRSADANTPRLVLVVGAADSTLQAVDVERGELLGKPLRPKTASTACLCLSALDLEALRTGPVHRYAVLSWSVPDTVPEVQEEDAPGADMEVTEREGSASLPSPSAFANETLQGELEGGRTMSFDQGTYATMVNHAAWCMSDDVILGVCRL